MKININKKEFEVDNNAVLEDVVKKHFKEKNIVAAKVNNNLCDLSDIVLENSNIELISLDDKDGLEVMRHTCAQAEKKKNEVEKIPQPSGWRMVLFPLKLQGKTKGGVLLTDETVTESQVTTNICKVLKMGPECYKDKEKFPSGPWCKEGDWVLITRYAGSRIRIDGGELRIINDDEILAVVDDPRDILPANIM